MAPSSPLSDDQLARVQAAKDYAKLITKLFEHSGKAKGAAASSPTVAEPPSNGDGAAVSRDDRSTRSRSRSQSRGAAPPRDRSRGSPQRSPSPAGSARNGSRARRTSPRGRRIDNRIRAPASRSPSPRGRSRSRSRSRGSRRPISRSPPPRRRRSRSRSWSRPRRYRSRSRSRDRRYRSRSRSPPPRRRRSRTPPPVRPRPDRKPQALITPVINRIINRIYVGNLSPNVTEAEIRLLFSKFGFIKELSMTRDPNLNTHKGWCFVEFDAPEAAAAAIRGTNGVELGDRPLKSNHTHGFTDDIWHHFQPKLPNRLYMASVHPLVTEEEMRELFEGVGKLTQFSICPDLTTFRHKGYGFAEYETEEDAQKAIKYLDGLMIGGDRLLVTPTLVGGPFPEGMAALSRFPRPRGGVPPMPSGGRPMIPKIDIEDPSPVLVLKNMVTADQVDEYLQEDVEEECRRHGNVKQVVVHVNPELKQRGGESDVRVFVEFELVEERQSCERVMNGRFFSGNQVTAGEYSLKKFESKRYDE
ncbi:Poly(U)-binding-splicing factor puf60 [Allomyces arbusculus]|nr:Poly(U)-binding-splicing factor puf60 [Allomyces arbusculus]